MTLLLSLAWSAAATKVMRLSLPLPASATWPNSRGQPSTAQSACVAWCYGRALRKLQQRQGTVLCRSGGWGCLPLGAQYRGVKELLPSHTQCRGELGVPTNLYTGMVHCWGPVASANAASAVCSPCWCNPGTRWSPSNLEVGQTCLRLSPPLSWGWVFLHIHVCILHNKLRPWLGCLSTIAALIKHNKILQGMTHNTFFPFTLVTGNVREIPAKW